MGRTVIPVRADFGHPYTCIDLDVKSDTNQEQLDRFWAIVQTFDSYTERSRSGQGLHIWVEGKIGKGKRRDGVEVYSQERFIICTGDVLIDKPIAQRPDLLKNMASQIGHVEVAPDHPVSDALQIEDDEVILKRAFNATNADKFKAHYTGNFSAIGHADHSKADAALVGMLAHFTRNNAQLKRLFLGSQLGQREKAVERADYVDRTIAAVRTMQAREPNSAHGERIAANIIANELLKRLNASRTVNPKISAEDDGAWIVNVADVLSNPSPAPEFLTAQLMPAGEVTLFAAHGGTGIACAGWIVSTLLQHIAQH